MLEEKIVDETKHERNYFSMSRILEKERERIDSYYNCCATNHKSVRVFDKSINSFVWMPESQTEELPEKFSVVLWAGTVGIGLKADGTTKEIRRSESEAWAEFLRDQATKEPVESKRKINSIETERENACLGENIDFVGRALVVGIVATVFSALIRVLIF